MPNTTVPKYIDFILEDSGDTMRSIPVDAINGLGLQYETLSFKAWQDLVDNVLTGHPDFNLEFSGPWTHAAAAAAGTLSGSHTILSPLDGLVTPLSFDIQCGLQAAWSGGDPQFGLTADANDGVILSKYEVDLSTMRYNAALRCVGGGILPAWGVAAEAAS